MAENETRTDWKAAAHDLNNFLTIILNSAELLKKKCGDSEFSSIIGNINSSARLAAELLEESFISPDAKRKLKVLNINGIIQSAAGSLSQKYSSKLKINLSLEENIRLIEARYSGCHRIFMNLIINSAEAIDDNGRIDISSKNISDATGKDFVEISVRDNGCGVQEEYFNRIFEKGFSTKQKSGLSGIGLSVVKDIVESFGGKINFQSSKNIGTEFILLFPAVSDAEFSAQPNKSILIAEDEDILRELLSDLLESYDYNVDKCANGNEVISKITSGQKYDLLIIDKKMPGMDGIECIRVLRKDNTSLPVILASGSYNDEDEVVLKELGIQKTVNKPYNFEDMFVIIRELIG